MLSTNRLKKIKSNFPVLVGNNVVSKNICNLLIKEISNSKSFDDMIMGGEVGLTKVQKILIYISKIQLTPQNFLSFLIVSLFIRKLKIYLQKILRMDRGLIYINHNHLILKSLLLKKN